MKEVVRTCEEFTAKLDMHPYFNLIGGDPILAPDFWPLVEYLHEKGYSYAVAGNPFHLTDDVLKRLKETGCSIYQLSLDGMEKTHDWFRKPGSFRATMETIPRIVKAGISSTIMMTVSSLNYREVPDVMDAVEAAGADGFSFARYVATSEDKSVGIEPLEYRKLLDIYAKKRWEAMRRGSFTQFILKDHLFALYYYEEGKFTPPKYDHIPGSHMPAGCHCGNAMLTILPDGTIMACRRMDGSDLGNIFRDDLFEMWTECKNTYRQYDKFEDCSRCKLSPWCRGCPAVAKAEGGRLFAKDPQCWHVVEE